MSSLTTPGQSRRQQEYASTPLERHLLRSASAVSPLSQDAQQMDGAEQVPRHRAVGEDAEPLGVPFAPIRLPLHRSHRLQTYGEVTSSGRLHGLCCGDTFPSVPSGQRSGFCASACHRGQIDARTKLLRTGVTRTHQREYRRHTRNRGGTPVRAGHDAICRQICSAGQSKDPPLRSRCVFWCSLKLTDEFGD